MEEKKPIKINLSTFFLILAIIVICIMAFYMYKLNSEKIELNQKNANLDDKIASLKLENEKTESEVTSNTTGQASQNNNTTSNITVKPELTQAKALEQAINTYKTAYNMLHSEKVMIPGEYSIEGGKKSGYKININEFEKVFSKRRINIIKSSLTENNGTYYDVKYNENDVTYFETIDVSTIFSSTDSEKRNLTIIDYTDKYIIAEGKLPVSEHYSEDLVPKCIIFVKENGKWLIDMYE